MDVQELQHIGLAKDIQMTVAGTLSRVLVFRDRIEIISPGHLPDNISTEEIKQGKTKRRNPVLSEHAAHLLPFRGLGSGIHRALEAWPQIELQDHRNGNEFKTVITRPEREVHVIAPVGIGSGDPVTGQVAGQVTQEVMSLLDCMNGEMKRAQIMGALNLAGRDNFRNLYLIPALETGLIEMTIPDKLNSDLQNYRLTVQAKGLVQAQQNQSNDESLMSIFYNHR